MLIDEVVDDRLMRGVDLLELNAHADAAVAPRDVPFRLDVALRPRHAEPDLDFRPRFERARRADRNPAVAQIQRQRRGDRVAEAILNRNAEHDARTAAAV